MLIQNVNPFKVFLFFLRSRIKQCFITFYGFLSFSLPGKKMFWWSLAVFVLSFGSGWKSKYQSLPKCPFCTGYMVYIAMGSNEEHEGTLGEIYFYNRQAILTKMQHMYLSIVGRLTRAKSSSYNYLLLYDFGILKIEVCITRATETIQCSIT